MLIVPLLTGFSEKKKERKMEANLIVHDDVNLYTLLGLLLEKTIKTASTVGGMTTSCYED
jgi:hypothetical protein